MAKVVTKSARCDPANEALDLSKRSPASKEDNYSSKEAEPEEEELPEEMHENLDSTAWSVGLDGFNIGHKQPMPFPEDGKADSAYGMWVQILIALGFKVVPVLAKIWKTAMGISGRQYAKDDSRTSAIALFLTWNRS